MIQPLVTNNASAQQENGGQIFGSTTGVTPCPFSASKNYNATVGTGKSYVPDVGCTCRVNQCRLSTGVKKYDGSTTIDSFENNSFICVPSTPGNTANPPVLRVDGSTGKYGDLDVNAFSDSTYWKTLIGPQGTQGTINTVYFLDLFSADSTKQTVPVGATCRTNPSDKDGTAYWFYPGYFSVMQGKIPDGQSNFTTCGGENGSNILFSSQDLFGNTVSGTPTIFGCLPNSLNGFVAFIVRLVSGLSIAISFLIILINLIKIISSSTNPDAVAESQKKMAAAFFTLVGILLTVTILSIFGLQIIGFGNAGLGGSLFRFFVGG